MTRFFGVGQEEILQAMRFAYERLKIVIERSSAEAFVPLLRQGHQLVSKRVGVMLTRGNVKWLRSWPRLDRIETMQQ
jgi:threonine dehydratase